MKRYYYAGNARDQRLIGAVGIDAGGLAKNPPGAEQQAVDRAPADKSPGGPVP